MNVYLLRRYLLFVVSLFINALGVAFITRAMLGTSPITSVTYVLSLFTSLTMGEWTIILNVGFVFLELFFMTRSDLRRDLRIYLLQIPISFCFGLFIDGAMSLLWWVGPVEYFSKLGYLLVGCVVLAVGIALEVKVNVAMTSGEYFVQAISRRIRREFGYVKLGFDVALVLIACVLSLVFMSVIDGVREGTVIAALIVGPIVHFISPFYGCLDRWIFGTPQPATPAAPAGQRPVVIAIAREYGSGGHLLGEMLSRKLGIKLYDSEFIRLAAERSGIDEEYILKNEQSIPSFWLKCVFSQSGGITPERGLSADDVLFVAESRIVQELSEREPCVIVGRCADFILRDSPRAIKVFCYCDASSAQRRCVEEYGIPADRAESEIRRINRNRGAHYEYYTGGKWGDCHHYHLMINTGSISLREASSLVESLYRDLAIS
ncbi:cytidylate kinase family protein [uncultured Alistipes sp.]|uniref:cytidylate kinase family protein n=1 Tax=uncultured Alistipes sp. TaxID=538949 RepID=UPI00266C420F|nr:cytidylate kinase family protein [uncultured Alistipes sp.]